MRIEYLLFDLDDTLLDFKLAEQRSISATLSHFGIAPTKSLADKYSEINAECWRALERGELTKSEVLTKRFDIFFRSICKDVNSSLVKEYYEVQLKHSAYLIPGAEELLRMLAPSFRLFAVSNGTAEVQYNRLSLSGIDRYFENVFLSEELGAAKPSREFFDTVIEKIGSPKRDKILIIGDSLTADIAGGEVAGIKSCFFNPRGLSAPPEIQPSYEISSLSEIPTLLEKINEKYEDR